MKTLTMRWMITAAALAVAAGSASAQTYKAEIPMPFRAAGKLMAPGPYEIQVSRSGGEIVRVHNETTSTSVLLVVGVRSDPPKQWRESGNPKIAFECVDGACTLSKIWGGSDPYLYNFPVPKAPTGDLVAHRPEVVALTMIKAR